MPEMIGQLCDAVEKAPNRRMTGTMLKAMGIDPSTARRQFQRHFGMTFQAYCRLRRMGQALQQIQEGDSVIGTQIDTGFASASGFWEAFKQVFGSPPSRAGQVACLFARWIDTPLGAMIALADDAGVHLIEFADRRGLKREIIALRRRLRCVVVPGENVHLKTIAAELGRYFGGSAVTFETPLVVSGSPFELAVWAYLRKITPGDTRSYADLARLVGKPGASRAVGRANGRNRLALVIPCHRVIRADGTMCGYGGGIWRKRWLLQHERKIGRGTAKCSSFSTTMVKP
jgi:AraC family transcriptional regulator of adaptative response/methylated-DNA-[protein]-cysteine methyltransferase